MSRQYFGTHPSCYSNWNDEIFPIFYLIFSLLYLQCWWHTPRFLFSTDFFFQLIEIFQCKMMNKCRENNETLTKFLFEWLILKAAFMSVTSDTPRWVCICGFTWNTALHDMRRWWRRRNSIFQLDLSTQKKKNLNSNPLKKIFRCGTGFLLSFLGLVFLEISKLLCKIFVERFLCFKRF